MTDEQKVREAFEVWAKSRPWFTKVNGNLKQTSDGNYCHYKVNDRWIAWQAAVAWMGGEGDAVAWLEVEPNVTLAHAVGKYGHFVHSMRVHIGSARPTKAQDANGLHPLYTRPPRADAVARDAERWRELCLQINSADPESNEASTIRNIVDDAINLGSTALDIHIDQALAAERGGE
jgi:hypothetical protein